MTRALGRWPIVAGVVWLALCATGMGALWSYSNKPGELGTPAPVWPAAETVPLGDDRPTLVMFAHPRCPCTSASVAELERLQRRFPGRFAVRVVFYEPADAGPEWRRTALWRRAAALPASVLVPDTDGRLARMCGAATSGVVGVYAPGGGLAFWGGITSARGHEGDSLGIDAIAGLLRGRDNARDRTSVYGCPILGSCTPIDRPAGGGAR